MAKKALEAKVIALPMLSEESGDCGVRSGEIYIPDIQTPSQDNQDHLGRR